MAQNLERLSSPFLPISAFSLTPSVQDIRHCLYAITFIISQFPSGGYKSSVPSLNEAQPAARAISSGGAGMARDQSGVPGSGAPHTDGGPPSAGLRGMRRVMPGRLREDGEEDSHWLLGLLCLTLSRFLVRLTNARDRRLCTLPVPETALTAFVHLGPLPARAYLEISSRDR